MQAIYKKSFKLMPGKLGRLPKVPESAMPGLQIGKLLI